jgi:hypothetical protein
MLTILWMTIIAAISGSDAVLEKTYIRTTVEGVLAL